MTADTILPIIAVLLMLFILAFVIGAAVQSSQLEQQHRELMELLNSQATMIGEWFENQNKQGKE